MARQRFLWPCIWNSEQFCSLSDEARLLFIGIISTADDEGRRKGSPASLKGEIFPQDTRPLESIASSLAEIHRSGLCRLYTIEGIEYLDIPKWREYQKPKYPSPSKIPQFREDSGNIPGTLPERSSMGRDGLGRVGLDRDGKGRVGMGREKQQPSRQKTPSVPPDGFPAFKDWAYAEWLAAGGEGAWDKAQWVSLARAFKALGDEPARRSWGAYLGEPAQFYAGHYPAKWSAEPARWLKPAVPEKLARTVQAGKRWVERKEATGEN